MPYTISGRNLMLDALRAAITYIGLFDAGTALTAVTGITSTDTFTKTAHGMANGTLVLVSGLTGGASLVVGRPYFVVATAANTFQLAHTVGGSAVDLGTDVTAATVTPYAELSGGSYARVAIAYAAAADGQIDDTTNGADVNVPAGATVDAVGYFTASSGGTLHSMTVQTPEGPYGSAGIYRVTDSKQHLNASGGS
jgi:hypothetical protein